MKKIITLLAVLAFISPALASAAPFIVDQGGTGAQTLPAGQLLVGNGKSPISATSSPTVDSINTSSTTATSTFNGNAYIKGNLRVDGNFYAPVSLVSSGNATINGVLTVTGVTQFADGAVGTPSVTFTADTNTGIYRGGNDILRFVTAGADRLTINASGNVGVGTTAPGSLLHLGGTPGAITSGLTFGDGDTGIFESGDDTLAFWRNGATEFYIDNNGFRSSSGKNFLAAGNSYYGWADRGGVKIEAPSSGNIAITGNVGIGTTGPTQKLEINGGMRLNTATAKPTCDSAVRGTFWFTQSGAGVKDAVEVCAKDAGDAYAWRTIY